MDELGEDKMKRQEKNKIKNCDHILIHNYLKVDVKTGKSYTCYGCIKCGATDQFLYMHDKKLSSKEKFVKKYTEHNNLYNGHNVIDRYCDLDLAQAIYSRIKENHPGIDDNTIMQAFKKELGEIRKIIQNDDKQKEVAKILTLKPNFNKWFAQDVQKCKTL